MRRKEVGMADREDFDPYVRERWVPLLRTATLLTGDRHAAEDLVQETLVRAAQHWSRVEAATADAYVRRILHTRSVDAWRWRRHQPDPVDAASHPEPVDRVAESPDAVAARLTLVGAVWLTIWMLVALRRSRKHGDDFLPVVLRLPL
jgi:DNA-directed RNA polymerase specialized sigma24 family protein